MWGIFNIVGTQRTAVGFICYCFKRENPMCCDKQQRVAFSEKIGYKLNLKYLKQCGSETVL